MLGKIYRSCLFVALLIGFIQPAHAGEYTVFGPKRFERGTGKPITETSTFSSPVVGGDFTLRLSSGDEEGNGRVSSGAVTLNGTPVAVPADFNQQIGAIERQVVLSAANELSLDLGGKPGAFLTLSIVGIDNNPPQVVIDTPTDGLLTEAEIIDVSGTVVDETPVTVSVNDVAAAVQGQTFAATAIPLAYGQNRLTATATDLGGNTATHVITVARTHPAPTVTLGVEPTQIKAGASALLSWTSTNADAVSIVPEIGTVAASGSLTVNPPETTTYVITATGPGGEAAAEALLTVEKPASAPTVFLSVRPEIVRSGEAATLSWDTTDADFVSIEPGIGEVRSQGSLEVIPRETTTYTITASGQDGTARAEVTLTVGDGKPGPKVSFSASPSSIVKGQSTTLSWMTQDADSVSIDPGIGYVATSGSLTVSPDTTTNYTLTAFGPTGTSVAEASVLLKTYVVQGSFGDRYQDLIPADTLKNTYDPKRFALITGEIRDLDDNPIPGVTVSLGANACIQCHGQEYGTVKSDTAGRFTLPVEGGSTMTVAYKKPGLITSHRQVYVPWNDIAIAETVRMIPEDSASTVVTFDGNPETVVTHRSTLVSDEFGARSATLVFTGDNKAYEVDAGGNIIRQLNSITTRATEFVTPDSMPANLPSTSAYTYCSEFSVDGAERVRFEKPVTAWVDNFLGFEVGEIVPVGNYDRDRGVWVSSDNGNVVMLLDTDGDGVVDALDSDGDNLPNDLNGDGSYKDEVQGLGDSIQYQPGATFWRVSLTHFTPWDLNWPPGPPSDAVLPNPDGEPEVDQQNIEEEKKPCDESSINSFVKDRARIFHEDIPVSGTDLSLHYASSRTKGFIHRIAIPVSGYNVPGSLEKIFVKVSLAGRLFERILSPLPNHKIYIEWDGLDHLGRPVVGAVDANIQIGFGYWPVYNRPGPLPQAFANAGIERPQSVFFRARQMIVLWRNTVKEIQVAGQSEGIVNSLAEGWSMSAHHSLSTKDHSTIFKGNGEISRESSLGVSLIAGGKHGDVKWAWSKYARNADLWGINSIAIAPDGSIYFTDGYWSRAGKIDTNGYIKAIANEYFVPFGYQKRSGYDGDNQPAGDALLNSPRDITVDSYGNVYIADTGNQRIRKIDVNGIITTVAGNGLCGFSGDGGFAMEASLCSPSGIALDRFGNLYISDSGNYRIRKVDTSGRIVTVAGNGEAGYGGDGGPALNASFGSPGKLAVDAAGNILVVDSNRIRKIDFSGRITTFVGNGNYGHSPDGTKAEMASLLSPRDVDIDSFGDVWISDYWYLLKVTNEGTIQTVAGNNDLFAQVTFTGPSSNAKIGAFTAGIDPSGNIYVGGYNDVCTHYAQYCFQSEYSVSGIWKIAPPAAFKSEDEAGNITLAGSDGLAHVFDSTGLHLETKDTDTGITRRTFSYDAGGLLTGMSDSLGNQIQIQRDSAGRPLSIISPDGLITNLTIDETNHLTRVTYPDGGSYRFEYSPMGLMTAETDPNNNRFEHGFNLTGRLTDVFDPEGGRWRYERSESADGSVHVSKTTGEGNITTYLDHTDATGVYTSTITGPSGGSTVFSRSADGLTDTTALSCGMEVVDKYGFDREYLHRFLKEHYESTPAGKKRLTLRDKTYLDTDADKVPDRITETVTLNGKATTLLHDVLQAKKDLISPAGRKVTSFYDPANLLTKRLSVSGLHDVTYAYDEKGRLTALGQGERQTSFAYTDKGFLASVTDPESRTTTYDHDAMGRVTAVHRPDGSAIGFIYDNNSNMTVLTNPSSVAHGFEYNANDYKTGYQAPQSGSYRYFYDKDRRLVETRFPSGKQIVNFYDKDRLASISTPEGEVTLSYLCATKLGSMSKGGETLSYTYDGKLVTSETAGGTLNQTLSYSYNNDFNVTGFTYAGATANFTYDNDGLLTGAGGYTLVRNAGNGLPESISGGSFTLGRSFNGYGEIEGETTTVGGVGRYAYSLARSPSGRINSKTETVGGEPISYAYTYDDLGRLATVTKDGQLVEQYQYDSIGRRTYEMNALRGIAGRSFAYSNEDHLLTAGEVTYQYDLDGFLTTKTQGTDVTTYSYSSRGELLKVVLPDGKIVEYVHDTLGRRIAKKINSVIVEKYLWQGLTRLLAVYDGNNNLLMRFQYADGRMPVAMTKGGTTYYLAYDQVGSLRAVADASGNIAKQIAYDTFGNILSDSNSAYKIPFGFAGGLRDTDMGLVRFGYRDYDPEIGRWTAKDPIGFEGGDADLFAYVVGNPVTFIDPLGLEQVVIGTIPGPNGNPIPIVRDTESKQWTPGFPNSYQDPFTDAAKSAGREALVCYKSGMDAVSGASDAVYDAIPEPLQPAMQPYPGFLGQVLNVLKPLKALIGK